jgi:hypothetical protein
MIVKGKAITNFSQALPPEGSDLAERLLKDPYQFDFLTLAASAKEQELERDLLIYLRDLLLELGRDLLLLAVRCRLKVTARRYREYDQRRGTKQIRDSSPIYLRLCPHAAAIFLGFINAAQVLRILIRIPIERAKLQAAGAAAPSPWHSGAVSLFSQECFLALRAFPIDGTILAEQQNTPIYSGKRKQYVGSPYPD